MNMSHINGELRHGSKLKPIKDIVLTEDCIDLISPDEGIILLTRAWVQFGDRMEGNIKKCYRNTYGMLKKLLLKSDGMKSKILRNHLRKYLNLKIKEKCSDSLFYIPPNGCFGFSKVKRENVSSLQDSLQIESLEALKVALSQFYVEEDEWSRLQSKQEIIDYIVMNI